MASVTTASRASNGWRSAICTGVMASAAGGEVPAFQPRTSTRESFTVTAGVTSSAATWSRFSTTKVEPLIATSPQLAQRSSAPAPAQVR